MAYRMSGRKLREDNVEMMEMILEVFRSTRPLTIGDVAHLLDIPYKKAWRYCMVLTEKGMLEDIGTATKGRGGKIPTLYKYIPQPEDSDLSHKAKEVSPPSLVGQVSRVTGPSPTSLMGQINRIVSSNKRKKKLKKG